jgi:hypothetical protein
MCRPRTRLGAIKIGTFGDEEPTAEEPARREEVAAER